MFNTRLRTACLVTLAAAAMLARTHSLGAQLFPPADAGMTMGHVLLNVSDVAAHRDFWTKQFDAKPVTVGKLEGVTIPAPSFCFACSRAQGRAKARRSITWV